MRVSALNTLSNPLSTEKVLLLKDRLRLACPVNMIVGTNLSLIFRITALRSMCLA